jgi:hypothetical protein
LIADPFGESFTPKDSKEGARGMRNETIHQLTERTRKQEPDFFSGKLRS